MKKLNLMFKEMQSKLQDRKGATMVEYALIVALIAVVAVTAVGDLGTKVNVAFDKIADTMPVK